MSRVDVVIPCYNYGHFLRECVGSVLSQSVDVRVLVIDDKSTDDTPVVGEALAREDARVTFRRHERNLGHIATYNEGLIGWAQSDYSLLLSADDVIAPGAFARAVDILDRHSEASMVYGMGVLFSGPVPTELASPEGPADYQLIQTTSFIRRCFEDVNPMETPTALVRTALQQKVGGYLPELPHTGDIEMWMRFAMHGPVAVVRAVQAFVRRHPTNMSAGYYQHRLRDCQQVVAAADTFVNAWGDRFPQMDAWRQTLVTRVSSSACTYACRAFEKSDMTEYAKALDFAQSINSQIERVPEWRKARVRRYLGPTLWRWLRWMTKGSQPAPSGRPASESSGPDGRWSGWWPVSS